MSSHRSVPVALAAAALLLAACHHGKPTQTPGGSDAAATADGGGDGAKTADASKATKIKCFGINECSGQGSCDVPDGRVAPGSKGHDCAGNNECRGKGWVLLAAGECGDKGGTPL